MKKNLLLLFCLITITSIEGMENPNSLIRAKKTYQEEEAISFEQYHKMSLLGAFTTYKKVEMTPEQRQKLSKLKKLALYPDVKVLTTGVTISASLAALSALAAYQGYPKTSLGLGVGAGLTAAGTGSIILAPPR